MPPCDVTAVSRAPDDNEGAVVGTSGMDDRGTVDEGAGALGGVVEELGEEGVLTLVPGRAVTGVNSLAIA